MAGVVGADVEQLRALSKTFMNAADRLQSVAAEATSRLASTRWIGPDADRHRGEWQSQSMTYLRTAADALRSAAAAIQRNAQEQEQASSGVGGGGVGGAFSGMPTTQPHGFSMPGLSQPNFGFSNPFDVYRDVMDQTPIWPISIGTALGMTPVSGITEKLDAAALLFDDRLSAQEKVAEAGHMLWDSGSGGLRQAGFDSKNPALYLAGVATAQWGDVAAELQKADFSAGTVQTTKDYIASNPGDAMKAATDAVVGYLPKMFSNFSINPFGK